MRSVISTYKLILSLCIPLPPLNLDLCHPSPVLCNILLSTFKSSIPFSTSEARLCSLRLSGSTVFFFKPTYIWAPLLVLFVLLSTHSPAHTQRIQSSFEQTEIKKHVKWIISDGVSLACVYVCVIFPVSSPEEVTCIFYLVDFQSC